MTKHHNLHSSMASPSGAAAMTSPNGASSPPQATTNGTDPEAQEAAGVTSPKSTTPGRKQLPPIPDLETQQSLANKAAEKKATSPPSNQTFGPFFAEYSLLAEYNLVQKQKLPGVYVIPSAKSVLFWNGVLFIRQGQYQGGVFRFSLHIPDTYPDADCPKLVFEPPLFHPMVDPESGELDVKRAFQKWRRNVNHIWQVLVYARRIFYKIDTKAPLNPEAAVLYEQDLDVFKSRVAATVQLCKDKLYDPPDTDDPHAIRFSRWDPVVHEEARTKLLSPKTKSQNEVGGKSAQTSGLSWMEAGSPSVFTRDDSASA